MVKLVMKGTKCVGIQEKELGDGNRSDQER